MISYKYYKSGIHYANIYFEDNGDVLASELDIYTNKFKPLRQITILDFEYTYVFLFKFKLENDSDIFAKDYHIGELVYTSEGEIYSKLDEYTFVQRNKSIPQDLVVVDHKMVGYIEPIGTYITVFIQDGFEQYTPLDIWSTHLPNEKIYAVEPIGTQMVKMRDGIELSALIFLPKDINERFLLYS